MNLYVINKDLPANYVLDTANMTFPAQVTDLRSGIVTVHTDAVSPAIKVGGVDKVLASFYCTIQVGEGSNFLTMESTSVYTDPDLFDYVAILLVTPEEAAQPVSVFMSMDPESFALVPINGVAVDVVPQSTPE